MDKILITDLEVFYRVGVPDEERARPQRLLLTIEIQHDFTAAAAADDVSKTIDYAAVCRELEGFGANQSWRLIETLAVAIADRLFDRFQAAAAEVTVKKFVIPAARYVGVTIRRASRRL